MSEPTSTAAQDAKNASPRERELLAALRQSEARYQQIIDSTSEGVWRIDSQGRTVFANLRMADLLGYTPSELHALTLYDICVERERPHADAHLQGLLVGESNQHDWCFKRKDGTNLWCSVSASPTYDENGRTNGALALITDVTARKLAEDRVRSLSRLYAVSSSVNEAMVRVNEPQALYDYACRIAVEQGQMSFSWIAIRAAESAPLQLVAYCGGNVEFVKQLIQRVNATSAHPGPAGRALREGVYAFSNDIGDDPHFFLRETALSLGMQSCAIFPMKQGAAVKGIFAIYSGQKNYFNDEELHVLNALADDISFAVESAAKQQALHESERMMATLFSNLPGMTYRCLNDAYWTMQVVSHGCLELTGYSQENFLSNRDISYERVIHPLDREMVRTEIETALISQRPFELTYRIVTAQGAQKWAFERGMGVFDAKGELRFLEGFITDVTARREAEQQVAAQAALLDKASDAIVLFGLDDTIHYWNHGAERLYGWSAKEAIGEKITRLIGGDIAQRSLLITKLLEQSEWVGELTQFGKSGQEVIIDASWTLVRDGIGQPRSILTINTDITQRKKLEVQFMSTQRMESIGTLAGGIAHDFNNILMAISGNTKLAASDLPANHPLQTHLREIQKASLRASDLVQQILTFSSKQEAQRHALKLQNVVAEALRLLRATLPAQIEILAEYDDNTPAVAADATQMHQVMINLGANAAYAMRDRGGVLSVRLDAVTIDASNTTHPTSLQPGRYARLIASDTGVGMDAATKERIFEPFFTTKTPGQGTGLDLAVVHGIVRSHGGAITVASEPGCGTTFCLYLPQTNAPAESQFTAPPVAHVSGGGQRILYVDDEEALVFLTTRVLERLGYQVTGRSDAKQALAEFHTDPMQFDAVVSDLSMPGMTGAELAREILAVRPDMPIVLTSGYIRDEDMKIVRELKIRDLVLKPNTVEDLGDTLHRVLARASN